MRRRCARAPRAPRPCLAVLGPPRTESPAGRVRQVGPGFRRPGAPPWKPSMLLTKFRRPPTGAAETSARTGSNTIPAEPGSTLAAVVRRHSGLPPGQAAPPCHPDPRDLARPCHARLREPPVASGDGRERNASSARTLARCSTVSSPGVASRARVQRESNEHIVGPYHRFGMAQDYCLVCQMSPCRAKTCASRRELVAACHRPRRSGRHATAPIRSARSGACGRSPAARSP